jgi:hypothetical protein
VLVPPFEVARRELARERLPFVRGFGLTIERDINRPPYCHSDELGPLALSRGCDALEIARAPIVELDKQLLHMDLYMLRVGASQGDYAIGD